MGDATAAALPATAGRAYGDAAAAPVMPIHQLRPLPQSWRKAALRTPRDGAAPAPALGEPPAAHSAQAAADASPHASRPSAPAGTGATWIDPFTPTAEAAGSSPYARTAQGSGAGSPAVPVDLQQRREPAADSLPGSPSFAIKPFVPHGGAPAAAAPAAPAAASSVALAGGVGAPPLPAFTAASTIHGNRTLAYSLSLIIEALSFNQMTLDSGFDAFDADGDGRISLRDFRASVDDLQLELDAQTVELMHRCLDADADAFIGRQEWITGLNAVQAGGFTARAPIPAQSLADDTAVRVPLGLDPSAQAHIAFETVRGRLEAALQQKAVSDSRIQTLGKLESQVGSAELAASHIKAEISAAIGELNSAIEFDLGRIADGERERQLAWDKKELEWEKERERVRKECDAERVQRLSLTEQMAALSEELAAANAAVKAAEEVKLGALARTKEVKQEAEAAAAGMRQELERGQLDQEAWREEFRRRMEEEQEKLKEEVKAEGERARTLVANAEDQRRTAERQFAVTKELLTHELEKARADTSSKGKQVLLVAMCM